jgi:hypothetical protein
MDMITDRWEGKKKGRVFETLPSLACVGCGLTEGYACGRLLLRRPIRQRIPVPRRRAAQGMGVAMAEAEFRTIRLPSMRVAAIHSKQAAGFADRMTKTQTTRQTNNALMCGFIRFLLRRIG